MNTLRADVARCDGYRKDNGQFYAECAKCLRRTAPRPDLSWFFTPGYNEKCGCEYLIEAKPNE